MDGTSLCGLTHSQAVATLKATINLDQVVLGIMEGPETSYGNLSDSIYRISANSFRGNYSSLNLTLCTLTFCHSPYRCGNYSREETIQGRKLYEEIQ